MHKELDDLSLTLQKDAKYLNESLQGLNTAVGSVNGASSAIEERAKAFGNTVGSASSATEQMIETADQIKTSAAALNQYQTDIGHKIAKLSQDLDGIQKGLSSLSERIENLAKEPKATD